MKNVLLDLVIEEVAADGVRDVADQRKRDVLVAVAIADFAGERHFLEPVDEHLIRLVLLEKAVVRVARQADTLAQDVAHGELLARLHVLQLETRKHAVDEGMLSWDT